MITIFKDKNGTGEYVVQSTALDIETFMLELATALPVALNAETDKEGSAWGILKNSMPLAYKLSGYKAETVHESRVLTCGIVSPAGCEILASSGK